MNKNVNWALYGLLAIVTGLLFFLRPPELPSRVSAPVQTQSEATATQRAILDRISSVSTGTQVWRDEAFVGKVLQVDKIKGTRVLITDPSRKIWDYLGASYRDLGEHGEYLVFYATDGVFKGWIARYLAYKNGQTSLEMFNPGAQSSAIAKDTALWVKGKLK
jgi:hypothetical protein